MTPSALPPTPPGVLHLILDLRLRYLAHFLPAIPLCTTFIIETEGCASLSTEAADRFGDRTLKPRSNPTFIHPARAIVQLPDYIPLIFPYRYWRGCLLCLAGTLLVTALGRMAACSMFSRNSRAICPPAQSCHSSTTT